MPPMAVTGFLPGYVSVMGPSQSLREHCRVWGGSWWRDVSDVIMQLHVDDGGDPSWEWSSRDDTNDGGLNRYRGSESARSREWFSRRNLLKTVATTTSLLSLPLSSSNAHAQSVNPTSNIPNEHAAKKNRPRLASAYYKNPPVTAPDYGRVFFPAFTPPFFQRATYRYDLVDPDTNKSPQTGMWALEQLLTFANVTATIRTNIIQLPTTEGDGKSDSPSLWVHGPLYPTGEYCHLLDELGTVKHVVLPCNAFEHKAAVKAFVDHYSETIESVWIAPGQYGPFGSSPGGNDLQNADSIEKMCKMGYRVDGILSDSSSTGRRPPWADYFEYKTLFVELKENAGPVSETAFFHKISKTLLTTDALVYIPSVLMSNSIFETYFTADNGKTVVRDDPFFWAKTVLQSVFLPLRYVEESDSFAGFEAIRERLVRAPILRGFNDARAPRETDDWIRGICHDWKFERIVTSHFASPILAGPDNVLDAFAFLPARKGVGQVDTRELPPISCQDWELLDGLNRVIADYKLGAAAVFDYHSDCARYI